MRTVLGSAAIAAALLAASVARADPIDISVRIVKPDGSAYAGLPVRLVVGSEPDSRAPNAGEILTTDNDGRISRTVDAPVVARKITLDVPFVKHDSIYVAVAVELDLLGRPALYWTDLDIVNGGTLSQMIAYVAVGDGFLDDMLTFHQGQHAWSFPDKPEGPMLTSIGADLKDHQFDKSADGKGWVVKLEIEKQEFQMR